MPPLARLHGRNQYAPSIRAEYEGLWPRGQETALVGSGSVWWGEATDEPAREDARPTGCCKLSHYPFVNQMHSN